MENGMISIKHVEIKFTKRPNLSYILRKKLTFTIIWKIIIILRKVSTHDEVLNTYAKNSQKQVYPMRSTIFQNSKKKIDPSVLIWISS